MSGVTLERHPARFDVLDALAPLDAVVLLIAEDECPLMGLASLVDWRLCGRLFRLRERGLFSGKKGERVLMPAGAQLPAMRVVALGLGTGEPLEAVGALAEVLVQGGWHRAALGARAPLPQALVEGLGRMLPEGLSLALHEM